MVEAGRPIVRVLHLADLVHVIGGDAAAELAVLGARDRRELAKSA
jgi:hypothetical protein